MHSVIHHFPPCMLLSQFNYLNILQSPYKTRTNRLLLAKQKPSRRRFRHLNTPFSAKQLRRSFDLPQDSSNYVEFDIRKSVGASMFLIKRYRNKFIWEKSKDDTTGELYTHRRQPSSDGHKNHRISRAYLRSH